MNTLGSALLGSRAFDEAERTFAAALRISREHGFAYFEAQACVGLAEVALALGSPQTACRVAGDALAVTARDAFRPLLGSALLVQARAALAAGDLVTASQRCEAATEMVGLAGVPGAVRECAVVRERIGAARAQEPSSVASSSARTRSACGVAPSSV